MIVSGSSCQGWSYAFSDVEIRTVCRDEQSGQVEYIQSEAPPGEHEYWLQLESLRVYYYYYNNYIGSGLPVNAVNINQYLNCFTYSQSSTYKVGIYVDQPKANARIYMDAFASERRAGHTYMMLEETTANNQVIRRIVGFYASGEPRPWDPTHVPVYADDSNSSYDVSLVVNLGQDYGKFSSFSGKLLQMLGTNYNLNNFNCTDAALEAFKQIGVNLPDTYGDWYVGGGTNPADLAEDLRIWGGVTSNMTRNTTGGLSPSNKGCAFN